MAFAIDLPWRKLPWTWAGLVALHQVNPLHYIIDTAPLFLGLAFAIAGRKQDQILQVNQGLEAQVAARTADLGQSNTELVAANEEIRQNLEEITAIHEQLENQNLQITGLLAAVQSSIGYAKRIQQALLPDPDYLQAVLSQHFVFYQPKDVVSGDFYWANQQNGKTFLAVADCTGHGVPGAFLSLLGIQALNRTVEAEGYLAVDQILDRLHHHVSTALQHDRQASHEGLEIGLCCLDHQARLLLFAGAKHSLFFFSQGQLHEIKGDRRSIGGRAEHQAHFTQFSLPLPQGQPTAFYLVTDGYRDQFSPQGKKMGYRQFRVWLAQAAQLPFADQAEFLRARFTQWQGHQRQLDDVLLLGFTA
ncbi:MAG: SpoIIE family protein phosphatase [Bernardetiaceae bacterium]|nr:SpoIIE family protein phosphatase [Bernardetiaceae bacterium]